MVDADAPRTEHLPDVIYLCKAISVRVENPVVDHPEVLGCGIDVYTRDYADAPDYALLVAAVLVARRLDLGPKALIQHGIVEDQIRSRISLQKWLYLLEQ